MIENPKFDKLISDLKNLEKVAIAFSGGVDSSFLLAASKMALGDQVVGITIDSPAIPRYELEDAIKIAKLVKARHIIIKSEEIEEEVKNNPVNRCYFCKKIEFGSVIDEAEKHGIQYVLDGSNADDTKDFRPGMKATSELKVLSPLLENKITKAEIREFSKILGLPTWDKPAYACLFSRIPYGHEIKKEDLIKIEKSEKYLIDKGFRTVRVRCHDDIARIEVQKDDLMKFVQEPFSSEVANTLKSFGFKFITLDLQGYRMGSFNEV
jgi:pyridinium-3,5-biscarboxylic acid mononucleotide sulfurtransferase